MLERPINTHTQLNDSQHHQGLQGPANFSITPHFDQIAGQQIDGIHLAHKAQRVEVSVIANSGVLLDVDDTLLLSNHPVYESKEGCYSLAIAALCKASGKIYNPNIWDELKLGSCLGRGLGGDCQNLSQKLALPDDPFLKIEERGLGISISPKAIKKLVQYIQKDKLPYFADKVQLVPGAQELLSDLKSKEIRSIICSAAPRTMAMGLLSRKGLTPYFDRFVVGATKKQADGTFARFAAERACNGRALKINPEHCIMFGDSMSDVATATLAGVKYVLIRIPQDSDQDHKIAKLVSDVDRILRRETIKSKYATSGRYISADRSNLIIFSEYQQLVVNKTSHTELSLKIH